MSNARTQREFTGRHMLLIMLAFFGVIITVNVIMAVSATRSWTGLVVDNTYIASQKFNERTERGRAQLELGWTGNISISPGKFIYSLTDKEGESVKLESASVLIHRPVSGNQDIEILLESLADGRYAGDVTLDDGSWIIEVEAEAGLASPYRDVQRVLVYGGALR